LQISHAHQLKFYGITLNKA